MTVWPCDGARAKKKIPMDGSKKPMPTPDIGANVVIIKCHVFCEIYTNLMKFCATAANCGYLSPLPFIRWGASQVLLFFFAMKQFELPTIPKTMKPWRFYFALQSSSVLAQLNRWKEENICQTIWEKSEVLLRTLCCQELGKSLLWPAPL